MSPQSSRLTAANTIRRGFSPRTHHSTVPPPAVFSTPRFRVWRKDCACPTAPAVRRHFCDTSGRHLKFKAWILLVRPLNLLITAVAVAVGALVSTGEAAVLTDSRLWTAMFVASIIAAGGYALNDAADYAIDRLNRPNRPVASGALSPSRARMTGLALSILGVLCAFMLPVEAFFIAVVTAPALLIYAAFSRSLPVIGNLLVAACAAAGFLFGSVAVRADIGQTWWPALFALLVHFARELLKDVEDLPGDRESGRKTLPLIQGTPLTLRLAGGVLLLTAMLTPVPGYAGNLHPVYLPVVLLSTALPMAYTAGGAIVYPDRFDVSSSQKRLKWLMLTGMGSFLTGALL
ncbi:hypothetical protein GF324_10995 [bacterium]|nr:hypothetical protein [bacterium]